MGATFLLTMSLLKSNSLLTSKQIIKHASIMKQNEYPSLEGVELLTEQAIASIEAAAAESSEVCDHCTKGNQHGGETSTGIDIPTAFEEK